MLTRRQLLKSSAAVGGGLVLSQSIGRWAYAQPPALLDPLTVPKFVRQLPNPLDPSFIFTGGPDYAVGIVALTQDLGLGAGVGPTPLWGYQNNADTVNQGPTYPGRTLVVQAKSPGSVQWRNGLDGKSYPPFVPVDTTLHWADPTFPTEFNGQPVPVVTHVHGANTDSNSDGLPEQWVLPGDTNDFSYDNNEEAGTIWYHDHALGVTRLNVYAGLAGFYIIRDGFDTGKPTNPLGLPTFPYEVPIVVQDKMFTAQGELYYPSDPATATQLFGPADYPDPTVMAEFFGDHIIVNGVAWPVLDVEPRLYRLRFLNGCDTRFLRMTFSGVPLFQIGTEQALLNAPVPITAVNIAPGERADVCVDFSRAAGKTVILRNNAPGTFRRPLVVNPRTTGRIMAFRVGTSVTNAVNNVLPATLRGGQAQPDRIPPLDPVQLATYPVRQLALYEGVDDLGRLQPLLGTLDGPLMWDEDTTEIISAGNTEIWELYNTTPDTHPIHLHLVRFRIWNQQKFNAKKFVPGNPASIALQGQPQAPAPEQAGWKDTVQVPPGTVVRLVATFPKTGEWVWHCHILSHEDHEMMRRFEVV